jgi:hypothetical protein
VGWRHAACFPVVHVENGIKEDSLKNQGESGTYGQRGDGRQPVTKQASNLTVPTRLITIAKQYTLITKQKSSYHWETSINKKVES